MTNLTLGVGAARAGLVAATIPGANRTPRKRLVVVSDWFVTTLREQLFMTHVSLRDRGLLPAYLGSPGKPRGAGSLSPRLATGRNRFGEVDHQGAEGISATVRRIAMAGESGNAAIDRSYDPCQRTGTGRGSLGSFTAGWLGSRAAGTRRL